MQWANHFTQIIDAAFAQRFTIVGTFVLYGKKNSFAPNETNPLTFYDQKSRMIFSKSYLGYRFTFKDFYPIHFATIFRRISTVKLWPNN